MCYAELGTVFVTDIWNTSVLNELAGFFLHLAHEACGWAARQWWAPLCSALGFCQPDFWEINGSCSVSFLPTEQATSLLPLPLHFRAFMWLMIRWLLHASRNLHPQEIVFWPRGGEKKWRYGLRQPGLKVGWNCSAGEEVDGARWRLGTSMGLLFPGQVLQLLVPGGRVQCPAVALCSGGCAPKTLEGVSLGQLLLPEQGVGPQFAEFGPNVFQRLSTL